MHYQVMGVMEGGVPSTHLAEDPAQVGHAGVMPGLLQGLDVLLGAGGVPALVVGHVPGLITSDPNPNPN